VMEVIKDAKNIQKIIDKFSENSHVILIANRLSNRGLNYTNSGYSRFITHQVSRSMTNYTNFIQKCRIFGIRKNVQAKPIIYCLTNENRMQPNFSEVLKETIKKKIENIVHQSEIVKTMRPINPNISALPLAKITVKVLKQLCRDNKISGFSKLKKKELIELLRSKNVVLSSSVNNIYL